MDWALCTPLAVSQLYRHKAAAGALSRYGSERVSFSVCHRNPSHAEKLHPRKIVSRRLREIAKRFLEGLHETSVSPANPITSIYPVPEWPKEVYPLLQTGPSWLVPAKREFLWPAKSELCC